MKKKRKKTKSTKVGFTNTIAAIVIAEDIAVTLPCLYFCYLCIVNGYTGSLPFLSALIGLQQAKSAVIVAFATNKSKHENTVGGVNYLKATQSNMNIDCD